MPGGSCSAFFSIFSGTGAGADGAQVEQASHGKEQHRRLWNSFLKKLCFPQGSHGLPQALHGLPQLGVQAGAQVLHGLPQLGAHVLHGLPQELHGDWQGT